MLSDLFFQSVVIICIRNPTSDAAILLATFTLSQSPRWRRRLHPRPRHLRYPHHHPRRLIFARRAYVDVPSN